MNFGVCDFSRFVVELTAALALVLFGAYDSYLPAFTSVLRGAGCGEDTPPAEKKIGNRSAQ